MKTKIFQAILFSNFPIGLLAFFQILGQANSHPPLYYGLCIALGSITLYTAQRLIKNQKIPLHKMSTRHLWIYHQKKNLYRFVLVTLAGTMILIPKAYQEIAWRWWMVIPLLCGLLYTGIPGTIFHGLREIPGIKSFLVALVWTMLTFLVPHHQSFSEKENLILFAHQFIFFWVIAIWFDWRDRNYDPKKLFTIPQIAGTKGTIAITIGAWALISLLGFQINSTWMSIDLVLGMLQLCLIAWMLKINNQETVLGFGMDGLILLQSIILLMV